MNMKAFFISITTWYIIYPSAFLCLIPMRHQLRCDMKKTAIRVFICTTLASLLVALLKAALPIPRNALIPLVIIPAFIIYMKSITAPVYKVVSVFVLVFAFMSFVVNISNGFDAAIHPTGTLNNFSMEAALFMAVISTVLAALFYYPASHHAARILDDFDIRRVYVASVPVWMIFLFFNLLISPRKYETLHVNLMQIAYWGSIILLLTLLCLLCVLFYDIVSGLMEKAETEEKARMLEMQESAYLAQQRYIEENARVRHDFKHVIATLDELSKAGDISSIRSYLEEYMAAQPQKDVVNFCRNTAVNALLNHYMRRARTNAIRLDWEIDLEEDTSVTDVDICSIIGNILENAILACMEVPEGSRFIDLGIRTEKGGSICIVSTNSFSGNVRMQNGTYTSTRIGGMGLGLKSIISTAGKYGGRARFSHEGTEFYADVIL